MVQVITQHIIQIPIQVTAQILIRAIKHTIHSRHILIPIQILTTLTHTIMGIGVKVGQMVSLILIQVIMGTEIIMITMFLHQQPIVTT